MNEIRPQDLFDAQACATCSVLLASCAAATAAICLAAAVFFCMGSVGMMFRAISAQIEIKFSKNGK